jgi:SagB-type dehydrogenase family enzyme
MLDASDAHTLALLFHLNSEPWHDDASEAAYRVEFKQLLDAEERVLLPRADGGGNVLQAISRRRSTRAFASQQMALGELAEILAAAYGLSRTISLPGGLEARARPVPSAGALYPLELYPLLSRVDGIADGLYHYDILDHALERLETDVGPETLDEVIVAAPFVRNANAVVFLSAVFDRTLHKYGARGYRYILLEAGHVAQNLCLLAAERGLASLCVGGFIDARVNRLLELEPRVEAVVYCVALGRPAEDSGVDPGFSS